MAQFILTALNNQVAEGGKFRFTMTRSDVVDGPVRVTVGGIVTLGQAELADVIGLPQQVNFSANQTSASFEIGTVLDGVVEAAETLQVGIFGVPDGSTVGSGLVTLTITQPPDYSVISAIGAPEGSGFIFGIVRSGQATTEPETITFSTSRGTAGSGDFAEVSSQVVTIPAGANRVDVLVQTTQDTIYESDETFTGTINGPSSGTISPGFGSHTVIINNDDPAPTYSIAVSPAAVNEGDAGAGNVLTYTVTRTASEVPDQVVISLSGTAAGVGIPDYGVSGLAVGNALQFAAGETQKTFTVTTIPDTVFETNETVIATISQISSNLGTIGTASAIGTITNDDIAPPTPPTPSPSPIVNIGTAGDDIIFGGDANDSLSGAAGNDSVAGAAGNDLVYGNQGNDSLAGGSGSDTVYGGQDNDVVYGGSSSTDSGDAGDELHGNKGIDVIYGNGGDDRIFGGEGADTAFGGQGNDVMFGGEGQVSTDDGADLVYGGVGNDVLYGNAGNDALFSNQDNDIIFGGQGNDFIHGGQGNDTLQGGVGNDTMNGGVGADKFLFATGGGSDRIESFNYGEGDRLDLGGQAYTRAFTNGNTILTLGDGGTITLIGTDAGIQLF